MGLWDVIKNLNNADGVREAMRMSYDKHLRKAQAGEISAPGSSLAQFALYGALATRYQASGLNPPEQTVWAELTPFMGLGDADGREYLAEYVVYRERPVEARTVPLRRKINEGLRAANTEVKAMAAVALMQGVAWGRLLDEPTRSMLDASLVIAR